MIEGYEPPKKRCDRCEHYKMIDSGYGDCYRFPPELILVRRFPLKYDIFRVTVAWYDFACGEYREDNLKHEVA